MSLEDVALEQAATYFWYAERFGWTPDQVDTMPAWLVGRMATVAAVHDEIQAERQEQAGKG